MQANTSSVAEEQTCEIKETNGFLQTVCADYGGFVIYKCPYSDQTYYIVKKLSFQSSDTFSKFCDNDPKGYQVGF